MTLEQKVRQVLVCTYSGTDAQNALSQTDVCGNFLLMGDNVSGLSTAQIRANSDLIHAQDPLAWLLIDLEGGRVARIPDGSPSARIMGNTNTAGVWGNNIGKLLADSGIDVDLAPVGDITENSPAIGDRSFADDPSLVSTNVNQFVTALQKNRVVAVIKHLPGHGRVLSDTHTGMGTLNYSWEEIKSFDLLPFVSAINNGAEVIMVGHIIIPELDSRPATVSQNTISHLREFLPRGNEIVFITDSLSMAGVGASVISPAIDALNAGEDLIMIKGLSPRDTFSSVVSAYKSGQLSVDQLNLSVARILRVKSQFGRK